MPAFQFRRYATRGDSNPAMWWVCHVMIHPSLTRRKMIGGDLDPWVETHGKNQPSLMRRVWERGHPARMNPMDGIQPSLTRRNIVVDARGPWVETHLNSIVATRRGRLGGDVVRGLKPTAKFGCRYAAKMRLQPTTNDPRPRVSAPRPRISVPRPMGFPPHGAGIPKSASSRAENHRTAGWVAPLVA